MVAEMGILQAQATSTDWRASGAAFSDTGTILGLAGLALFTGGLGALLLRAYLSRRRYRATGVLGPEDLGAIHEALIAAERKSVGEILPVVLERSDRHEAAAWLAALTLLGAGSFLLAPWLPWGSPLLVLAIQLVLAAAGYGAARALPGFLRFFVGEARAREMAEEQAFQEFHRYDLARTEQRTGVLLFVSLLERHAIVLADEGIDARVAPEQWQATNEAVLAGLRRGSLRDGLVEGIRTAGALLAAHFPPAAGDRNEVPDRVIVRRE